MIGQYRIRDSVPICKVTKRLLEERSSSLSSDDFSIQDSDSAEDLSGHEDVDDKDNVIITTWNYCLVKVFGKS